MFANNTPEEVLNLRKLSSFNTSFKNLTTFEEESPFLMFPGVGLNRAFYGNFQKG
jgi:hypothetical protein